MIHLEWPWLLAALPLPFLVRWLLPAADGAREAALRVPALAEFEALAGGRMIHVSRRLLLWLAALAWALLVLASSRPQWLGEPVALPSTGRDLLLAVDLSGSMEERDFMLNGQSVNRLTATKVVAGDFLVRREGDRLGLILFGERAYVQAPLSFDRHTVRTLLDESVIGLAGRATAIGDAIGLAVKRLRERPADSRVLILLTDGANTAGQVAPLQAAELAAREGLRIYTIGVGAETALVRDIFGTRRVNPSRDLDEPTLREIAKVTGGQYFRARDTAELESIYAEIDALEPVEQDPLSFRPVKALYHLPLAAALILAGLVAWLTTQRSPAS